MAAGLFAGEATSPQLSYSAAPAQRFEAMVRPSAADPRSGSSGFAGERYVDEASPADLSSARPVTLPADFLSTGKALSGELMANRSKVGQLFDEGETLHPSVVRFREQLNALTELQQSVTQYHLMMKGVELTSQGFQQLFKMQG